MAKKFTIFDTAHELAKEGRFDDLAQMLIAQEEDDTFIDHVHAKTQSTMLTTACGEGQFDIVTLLCDSDCKLDLVNGKGNTGLIEAAAYGYVDIVELLIQRGAELDVKGHLGETAIAAAAKGGHENCLNLLIANQANAKIPNDNGETPLMIAIRQEVFKASTLIMKLVSDADINGNDKYGENVLLRSVFGGRADAVNYILDNKGNVNCKNKNGESALVVACKNRNVALVKLLLNRGADATLVDNMNRTPLIWACMNIYPDIAEILLKTKVTETGKPVLIDINAVDIYGYNALMFAVKSPAFNASLELFIDMSADTNAQDRQFNTSLFHACMKQNIEGACFLIRYGYGEPHLTNEDGMHPCDYLIDSGHKSLYGDAVQAAARKKTKDPSMGYKTKPHWFEDTAGIAWEVLPSSALPPPTEEPTKNNEDVQSSTWNEQPLEGDPKVASTVKEDNPKAASAVKEDEAAEVNNLKGAPIGKDFADAPAAPPSAAVKTKPVVQPTPTPS